MKTPEHMDSTDSCPGDGRPFTDEEKRAACRDWLGKHDAELDAAEFFEAYLDPEGPFRYCGSFDAWDGIHDFLTHNHSVTRACIIRVCLRKEARRSSEAKATYVRLAAAPQLLIRPITKCFKSCLLLIATCLPSWLVKVLLADFGFIIGSFLGFLVALYSGFIEFGC